MKPLIVVTCLSVLAYVGYMAFLAPEDGDALATRVYQCRDQIHVLSEPAIAECMKALERYGEYLAENR